MDVASIGSPALWFGFITFVLAMLALDLGVFHKKAHEVSFKEAATWSAVWIGLAMLFNVGVWLWFGSGPALSFLTGYVIEKSLSVDNIFVFVMIFSAFAVPAAYQHRVLFWGILGALVLRCALILAGAALVTRFHWVMYIFGAILIFTAVKMLVSRGGASDPRDSVVLRAFRRFVPTTDSMRGQAFLVKEGGRWLATPLLLVLVLVEFTDLVFAVDSIPAIFAITTDPFIVFTSNIFAILGLRSLYFMLAGAVHKFRYLKLGLSIVLAFVGTKLLISGFYKVPLAWSLGVIAVVLTGSVVASLIVSARRGSSEVQASTTTSAEDGKQSVAKAA